MHSELIESKKCTEILVVATSNLKPEIKKFVRSMQFH